MKRYECNKCGFNFCDYEKKKTCPECGSKDLKETFDDQTDFPIKTKSPFLQELPQYHFDRDAFVESFKKVFSTDEIFEMEVACQEHRSLSDFHLYYAEDEFYIIHLKSGTIINWYKHLGRTNTCNKEGFSLDDLQELLQLLKEDLEGD